MEERRGKKGGREREIGKEGRRKETEGWSREGRMVNDNKATEVTDHHST